MKFTYTGEAEGVFPNVTLADGSVLTAVPQMTYELLADPESDLFAAAADSLVAIATGEEARAATWAGKLAASLNGVGEVAPEEPETASETPVAPAEAPEVPTQPDAPSV